eukprot:scaffold7205_cov523-Prasinococcus_capsulatus_cf.AAC.4
MLDAVQITLSVGTPYIEPGFIATDFFPLEQGIVDLTDNVAMAGFVNFQVPGKSNAGRRRLTNVQQVAASSVADSLDPGDGIKSSIYTIYPYPCTSSASRRWRIWPRRTPGGGTQGGRARRVYVAVHLPGPSPQGRNIRRVQHAAHASGRVLVAAPPPTSPSRCRAPEAPESTPIQELAAPSPADITSRV